MSPLHRQCISKNVSSGALAEVLLGAPGVIVADDGGPLPLIHNLWDFVVAVVVHPSSLGHCLLMLPPYGLLHSRPPTPSESLSSGLSITFNLSLKAATLGATTPCSTWAVTPVVSIINPGASRPHLTYLTQAFIPVVNI
ncbi:hypothetical protein BJY52DRAFT_1192618 [Lactarius psammicola]|nr:hypothetical protein BJY52DRAFT_1192618 [Lactarius psammicola]